MFLSSIFFNHTHTQQKCFSKMKFTYAQTPKEKMRFKRTKLIKIGLFMNWSKPYIVIHSPPPLTVVHMSLAMFINFFSRQKPKKHTFSHRKQRYSVETLNNTWKWLFCDKYYVLNCVRIELQSASSRTTNKDNVYKRARK